MLPARVLDPTILQVFVEPRLVDRHQRPQAHRHGRKLPEPRHQPGVRIARQAAALGEFAAEVLQLLFGDPPLEKCPRVDARRGVALKVDLVARVVVAAAADEVIHRHLDERGRRGERGDVTADALVFAIGANHHRHRVPADDALDPSLNLAIAREGRLLVDRNRVDVRRGRRERNRHAKPIRLLLDRLQQIGGPVATAAIDHVPQ